MILHLHRFCLSDTGTFGTLWTVGNKFYTVERQWLDNRPYDSCIPEGVWPLRRERYQRGGYDTLAVEVPGRMHILFHRANLPSEVHGCVGIGNGLGAIDGEWAVTSSRLGFNRWWSLINSGPTPGYLWVTSGHERDNNG